jgi:molybdopterin converting factor small subunit
LPAVHVRLPRSLLTYWGGKPDVSVDAVDVAGALAEVAKQHPGVGDRILDETGRLREHVHVFVNRNAVRDPHTRLAAGDVVHILPAVSGG